MMPTGDIPNKVETADFSMINFIAPHHINFYKQSSDSMDIILLGTLHRRLNRKVEP